MRAIKVVRNQKNFLFLLLDYIFSFAIIDKINATSIVFWWFGLKSLNQGMQPLSSLGVGLKISEKSLLGGVGRKGGQKFLFWWWGILLWGERGGGGRGGEGDIILTNLIYVRDI